MLDIIHIITYLVTLLQPSFLGGATRHSPHDAREGTPVRSCFAPYHPHAKSTRCNKRTWVKDERRTSTKVIQCRNFRGYLSSLWVGFASSSREHAGLLHVSYASAVSKRNAVYVSQRRNSRARSFPQCFPHSWIYMYSRVRPKLQRRV